MPSPHDHDAWAANRKEKIAQRDKLRAERQGEKKDAGAGAGKKRAATNGKLKLAKSFKTALVSKVQLSDAEVKDIVDDAMANAKNDSDDESKE